MAYPEAPVNIEHAAGDAAGLYVDAIAQHVLSIAALFEARQVALSLWPLIRAELEIAGRVGWMLDPETDTVAMPAEARVARFNMELLASWCREAFTASKLRRANRERTAKSQRDRQRGVLECVFPGTQTDWRTPGDEMEWNVRGQNYLGLGRGVEKFAQVHFNGVHGLYDLLSDYAHPSLIRLSTQSRRSDDGSGVATLSYELDRELLEWQVRLGCLILYKAAHLVVGYFDLDDSGLESWAIGVPTNWFNDWRDEW
ncbi:hypothetical protein LT337_09945 [Mycolicibacterium fortuitum]|nr:hypothetical protein LT337_09945 [Mycolicibacterium fortuitum]